MRRPPTSSPNVRFEVRDIADLPADTDFDVVTAFDAIHDQVAPRRVLAAVRRCIRPGGAFVMVNMDASSNLEDNIGNQMAAFFYSVSLMHCLQVSLASDGEGARHRRGRQKAVELLDEAGFGGVQVIDTPPEERDLRRLVPDPTGSSAPPLLGRLRGPSCAAQRRR